MGGDNAALRQGGPPSACGGRPGRLIHKADFENLLSASAWSRSTHFALHHVACGPTREKWRRAGLGEEMLSTELCRPGHQLVDNGAPRIWIGAVIPKRHARRSATRNLLKRQVREAFVRHEMLLPRGLWLVRLRRVFATQEFPSARSARLAQAARLELDQLLTQAPGRGLARTVVQPGRAATPPPAQT